MNCHKECQRLYQYGLVFYLTCLILLAGESEVLVAAKGSNYYTAAVFEHVRYDDFSKSTPQEVIQRNLNRYATAAKTAAKQGTDIIVFPEWGLFRHVRGNRSTIIPFAEDVPNPLKGQWNPCEDEALINDRPVLRYLSCMAKNNAMYLVANMADTKKCDPEDTCQMNGCSANSRQCPEDGRKFFNTNVVFDRSGTLVARYHKGHLYFQPDFNTPVYTKPAYFETDFGLFTTFICFDVAFREAVEAIERKNVLNVAFPTSWYDHLPLMSAIQYQEAWAIANKVNLLAADVHRLGTGTIGSGIYSGTKGALLYTFNPDNEAKLLISRVPIGKDFPPDFKTEAKIFRIRDEDVKDITDEDQDSKVPEQCSRKILGPPNDVTKDYRCTELNSTGYDFKKLEVPKGKLKVCKHSTCCSLSYSADSMKEDYYLGVQNGIGWIYDTYGFCVEVCILVRCDRKEGNGPCTTYPLVAKTRFRTLELSGNFTTKYVYPSVTKSKMRLAPTKEWEFRNNGGQAQIVYDSKSENGEPILSVGLSGRCYDKDPPPPP